MATFKPFAIMEEEDYYDDRHFYMLACGIVNFKDDNGKIDNEELVISAMHSIGLSQSPNDFARHIAKTRPEVFMSTIEVKCIFKHLWDDVVSGKIDHIQWDGRDIQVCLGSIIEDGIETNLDEDN